MRVATFYADCELPTRPRAKSVGFDWHAAIRALERSARASLGADTLLVTDERTAVQKPALRVGNARADGIMLWLLDAQAAAIRAGEGPLLMVSPDTLIAGRLDALFGDWDVCLLTRARPKPIVNSVIAIRASAALADLWGRMARAARGYSEESRSWGVDIDVLVDAFAVRPKEDAMREIDGLRVRLMPVDGIFQTVTPGRQPDVPIWDFKGYKKAWMPQFVAMLGQ